MPFQNIYGLWGPSLIVLEKNENRQTDRQTDRQTRQIYIERDKNTIKSENNWTRRPKMLDSNPILESES